MNLGDRIKLLRREKEMTQKELADKMQLSAAAISQFEHGRRVPTPKGITQLACTLNVSTDYLLGLTDEPKTKVYQDPAIVEIVNKLTSLETEDKEAAIKFIDYLFNGKTGFTGGNSTLRVK